MAQSMKVNGILTRRRMEKVFKSGLMALYMKATGKTTKLMAEVV